MSRWDGRKQKRIIKCLDKDLLSIAPTLSTPPHLWSVILLLNGDGFIRFDLPSEFQELSNENATLVSSEIQELIITCIKLIKSSTEIN